MQNQGLTINLTFLRYTGNILSVIGYAILLHIDPVIGGLIKVFGVCIILPSLISLKLWDAIALISFFGAIDVSNIFVNL